jgi:hypothetical protein
MRRGLLLTTGLGLLATVIGCCTHGACDCDVQPIGSGTPCPVGVIKPIPADGGLPGGPGLTPEPIREMPRVSETLRPQAAG